MSADAAGPVIILMRHGQIPQSEPRRFVGQRDLPLDQAGREQADAAGRWLAACLAAGPEPEGICCSDLVRTRETAERVAGCLGLGSESVTPMAGLREIGLGQWEGLSKDEVEQQFPGQLEVRGRDLAGYRPPEGESFADLQERFCEAFQTVAEKTRRLGIVIAHAGANRALLCRLLGMPLNNIFSLEQDYCCVNVLAPSSGPLLPAGGSAWHKRWMVRHCNILPWAAGGVVI